MRTITFLLSIMLLVNACKSKTAKEEEKKQEATTLPPATTSAADVKKWITNKDLVTIKAGLVAPGGSSYEWVENSDTTAFAKEFLDREMSFELHLNYDSTGVLFYGKLPSWDSTGKFIYIPDLSGITYKVEDGVVLDVVVLKRYPDGSIEPLGTTYKVLGADEKSILLQAPRGYLDKDVVVLLSIRENPEKMKN